MTAPIEMFGVLIYPEDCRRLEEALALVTEAERRAARESIDIRIF